MRNFIKILILQNLSNYFSNLNRYNMYECICFMFFNFNFDYSKYDYILN